VVRRVTRASASLPEHPTTEYDLLRVAVGLGAVSVGGPLSPSERDAIETAEALGDKPGDGLVTQTAGDDRSDQHLSG
jgi:hypothetical protein